MFTSLIFFADSELSLLDYSVNCSTGMGSDKRLPWLFSPYKNNTRCRKTWVPKHRKMFRAYYMKHNWVSRRLQPRNLERTFSLDSLATAVSGHPWTRKITTALVLVEDCYATPASVRWDLWVTVNTTQLSQLDTLWRCTDARTLTEYILLHFTLRIIHCSCMPSLEKKGRQSCWCTYIQTYIDRKIHKLSLHIVFFVTASMSANKHPLHKHTHFQFSFMLK